MPVSISGDGAITGLELESFEDVDVGSGASDGDVLTYDATGDLWIPQGVDLAAGIGSNVVQTVKTDVFTSSSTSFIAVTGLSATITPSSATSKVLVIVQVSISATGSVAGRLSGGNTSAFVGDAAGNRIRNIFQVQSIAYRVDVVNMLQTIVFLDSPASAVAVTYTPQFRINDAANAFFINRSQFDADSAFYGRGASSITVIEVAA